VTSRPALTLLQRDQRKLNLLLASRLARGQAMIALDELGGRADSVADSVARVREWLSSPLVWTLGSAVGALLLSIRKRRAGGVGLLSLVWPAWRVWRSVSAVVTSNRTSASGSTGLSRRRGWR